MAEADVSEISCEPPEDFGVRFTPDISPGNLLSCLSSQLHWDPKQKDSHEGGLGWLSPSFGSCF
jgi:hypothetical protein